MGKEMPDRSHCDSGTLFGKSDSKKKWLRPTKPPEPNFVVHVGSCLKQLRLT
jgi:hypothetical protein